MLLEQTLSKGITLVSPGGFFPVVLEGFYISQPVLVAKEHLSVLAAPSSCPHRTFTCPDCSISSPGFGIARTKANKLHCVIRESSLACLTLGKGRDRPGIPRGREVVGEGVALQGQG